MMRYIFAAILVLMLAALMPGDRACAEAILDAADTARLVDAARGGGADEAVKAREELVALGPDAVPSLIGGLNNKDGIEYVLLVIGEIGDGRAIEPVADLLGDGDWNVVNPARAALEKFGDRASATLLGLLSEEGHVNNALHVLSRIEPSEKSLGMAREMLKSPDPGTRGGAAVALGQWEDKASEGEMVRLMTDESAQVRIMALVGYGWLDESRPAGYDRKLLLGMMKDNEAGVRLQAAKLLGYTDNREIVPELIDTLKSEKDDEIRAQLLVCVEETGDQRLVVPLTDILTEEAPAPLVLSNTVYVLGELDAKESVPFIVDLFRGNKGESVRVQKESFPVIAKLGEDVDVEIFLKYLKPGDRHEVSTGEVLYLIDELARPGDDKVIEALEEYIGIETDPRRLKRAEGILEKLR
jgi:HEAT repeat protein